VEVVELDPFDALDEEKLQRIIVVLKDADISYFECGSVKIGFTPTEPERPATGFVPMDQRVGTQAARESDDDGTPSHYRKAFGGRVPSFHKPRPKDE
jgi:hypothetical protein